MNYLMVAKKGLKLLNGIKKSPLWVKILMSVVAFMSIFVLSVFLSFFVIIGATTSVVSGEQEASYLLDEESEDIGIDVPHHLFSLYEEAEEEYEEVAWTLLMATHGVMTDFAESSGFFSFHNDALNLPNSVWNNYQVSKREIDYQNNFTGEEDEDREPYEPDRGKLEDVVFTLANFYSRFDWEVEEDIEEALGIITRNNKKDSDQIRLMYWLFSSKYKGQAFWPVPVEFGAAHITSPFGDRVHPLTGIVTFHAGIDIGAPFGTPIYAIDDGVVTYSGVSGELGEPGKPGKGYGTLIIIDHGEGMESWYGHSQALFVEAGEEVYAGQLIAEVGSEGGSTGAHLDISIRIDGEPVDPMGYLIPPD